MALFSLAAPVLLSIIFPTIFLSLFILLLTPLNLLGSGGERKDNLTGKRSDGTNSLCMISSEETHFSYELLLSLPLQIIPRSVVLGNCNSPFIYYVISLQIVIVKIYNDSITA